MINYELNKYKMMKRNLLLTLLLTFVVSLTAFGQTTTFSGTVVDANGEPIIGASIIQKGTSNGSISDLDGKFTIKVDASATIVISYVGYQTVECKPSADMRIVMKEEAKLLNDVVVIGYGVQKKSVVTASIAKISSDALAETSPSRIDQALKGLAAGVQVTTANGQPGATSKIRIRGTGTINDSDPLYIVDGMAISGGIDNINPADIESIEVLKDAASGAIYGARAANGVVLVTTKKGTAGKTRVSYNGYFGWQTKWKERDMLNASEYATLMNEAAEYNSPGSSKFSDPTSLGEGTNWQDEIFYDGAPVTDHEISISGGNDKLNYYLSFGYFNQKGIIGGNYGKSNYRRFTIRDNMEAKIFDESKNRNWLKDMKVSLNVSYSRIHSQEILAGSLTESILGEALQLDPTMSVYADSEEDLLAIAGSNYNSSYGDFIRDQLTGKLLNVPSPDFNELGNPLARLSLPTDHNNSDKIIGTLSAEVGIWDNLRYKISWGSDLAFSGVDGYTIPYYLNKNSRNSISSVTSTMMREYTWQLENVLTWDKTFGDLSISAVLGQSAMRYTGRYLKGTAQDLVELMANKANLDFTTGLASDGKRNAYGSAEDPHSLASYFGRVSANYAERYMLQFTIRRDGSSRFGTNNKWATFPSFSLGWNITNEPFMQKRPNWYTNTKLRFSWGKNGNENIGDFRYMANVQFNNNYVFGKYGSTQAIYMGSKPSITPNPDLKWEESEQYDVGADFGFFSNALTFTVDYFYKKTNGMLKEMSIPNYLGESKPYGNVGKMKNEGVEFELGYKYVNKGFRFGVQANLSYLKNELIDLGNADGFETMDGVFQLGNISRAENGEPYPYFWGYKTNGIFQNEEEVQAYTNSAGELLQPNAQPGDVRFVDVNGDGAIDDNDKTKLGKGDPDWTFGVNLTASYKGFDFSMLVSGQWGNKIAEVIRRLDCQWVNLPQEYINRWHGEGTSNTMPRFCWNGDDNNKNWGRFSDLYLHDGAFARIKNIQLGYTLPQSFTRKFFVDRLRVYVAAENLLTITGYDGLDPELNNDTANGIDRGYYPQARTFKVGFNINF